MTRTIHFPDGAVFVRLNAMALVGMSDRSPAMNDEERADAAALVTQACAEVLPRSADGGALTFEIGANLATAVND